jgi:DNA-binding CsgD family transcriptional regulator
VATPAGSTDLARPSALLGRDEEWAAIRGFLHLIPSGPAALVIDGDAGIGKTALWQAALAAATGEGWTVIRARPAGTDAAVSYSLLLDLFDSIPAQAFAGLPHPQRDALEVVLRRRGPDASADQATIAVAALAVLRTLAKVAPVLVAIDDFHVADPAGIRVLEFAIRRLESERLGLLVAQRPEGDATDRLRLGDALPPDRLRVVRPGPMSAGALHRLIVSRVGVALPRPVVVRIRATTGGNPQFALEVARELVARGPATLTVSTPLPVPGSLQEVVQRRLAGLDDDTRRIVAVAAEMERPSRQGLRLAVDTDDVDRAIDAAIDADVLVPDRAGLTFSHPIVRAAAAQSIAAGDRRAVHARLARIATDPEERAHHLGLATLDPDEAVAAALQAGAEAAMRRGAPEAALRLRERALDLTPVEDGASYARRSLQLADAVSDAGDPARGRSLISAVLAPGSGADADTRCDAAILLGTLMWFDGQGAAGRALMMDMLEEVAGKPALEARIHSRLTWMTDDDPAQAAAHADAALQRLDPERDPVAYAFALLNRAVGTVIAGGPPDEAAIRLGAALQEAHPTAELSSLPGVWPLYADRLGESRAWLEKELDRLRAVGDEGSMGQTLGYLASVETRAGRLDLARRYAEEGLELIRQIGQNGMVGIAVGRVALIDAIEGREAAARDGLEEMRRQDVAMGGDWTHALYEQTVAFVALSTGDFVAAERAASEAAAAVQRLGMVDPAMFRFDADRIEAVIELGDLEQAERLLDRFEERDRIVPRPWITATAARCRALVAAVRGDLPAAIAHLEAALVAHERLDWPLEHVRTLLIGVRVLRRANQRKRALELASEAARIARSIGAAPWAARAEAEAARLGLEHGDGDRLTPSERRMAELAAGGSTNREIAERLLVSPKTVEATLARAYAKLGIRSRAQLHARLAEEPPAT